jgi:hypothetical protein
MARMRAVLVLAAVLPGLAHIPSLRVRSSYRDAGLRHMREQYRGAALPIDQWFTQVRADPPHESASGELTLRGAWPWPNTAACRPWITLTRSTRTHGSSATGQMSSTGRVRAESAD